ncbi:MAG: hypothetical protein QM703_14995 [Gemmatales bacterium]
MRHISKILLTCLIPLAAAGELNAQRGGRGGGGGGRVGGGGGGGFHGGGGAVNRGNMGGGGMNRPAPQINRPTSIPNVSRPSPNIGQQRPQVNRPANLPSRPSQPNLGGGNLGGGNLGANRPTTRPSLPNNNLGGGGNLGGINRPGGGGATTLPGNVNRPNLGGGSAGINRPGTSLPGIGGNTRPSLPNNGGGGAGIGGVTRPGGGGGDRPNLGGITRPGGGGATTLPSTGDRPNLGGVTRPGIGGGDRPNLGGGGVTRPTPGGVGDWLGLDRPIRPPGGEGGITRPGGGGATTLPGGIADNRPGIGGGNRPGAGGGGIERPSLPGKDGDRPTFPGKDGNRPTLPGKDGDRPTFPGKDGNRPTFPGKDGDRPGAGGGGIQRPDRPGGGGNRPDRPIINRPVNPGDRINNNFNNRPSWVNINNTQINNINRSWNNTIVRPNSNMWGWGARNPARMGFWTGWGMGVRTGWGMRPWNRGWFGPTWWGAHPFAPGGWHYYHQFAFHPWGFWWTRPAWPVFNTWFAWSTPPVSFAQPIFYDYGTGGNVTFVDNSVFIGGDKISSTAEFAESAAALATVDPPANQQEADDAEWLPLGTFALSTNEKDKEPSRVVQLAVNKQGIISGTMFNYETEQTQAIQGKVDKDTQRVAFRIGDKDNVVAETGLYNLTQDEAPLLVHFGPVKQESFLLVRLESEEDKKTEGK